MGFTDFLEWLGTQLWGMPFLVFTIVIGVYYVFATRRDLPFTDIIDSLFPVNKIGEVRIPPHQFFRMFWKSLRLYSIL